MTNLIELYTGADGGRQPLAEMKLGPQPAMIQLFTADAQETRLHFVDDETVRAYVVCPGAGCPVCYCGTRATAFHLLPAYDVESQTVKVLRVPENRRPDGLIAKLLPHMRDPDIAGKVILLSREGASYTVEARPLGPGAQRGDAAIKAFLDAHRQGLDLESAFLHMTPEALAEVPKIANRVGAIGGWQPPRRGKEGAAAAGDGSEPR